MITLYRVIDISDSLPRHPTREWTVRATPTRIVVHTTASDNQDPHKTARYHITPGKDNHISQKGAPGLCYHDFVTKDGCVYHCNDYKYSTWHAGLYNKTSIGLVMAYKGKHPNMTQYDSMIQQAVKICLQFGITPQNVIGHREVPGMWTFIGKTDQKKYKKQCPGEDIDLSGMRKLIAGRLQRFLAAEGLYAGKIDSIFGKASKAALKSYVECRK